MHMHAMSVAVAPSLAGVRSTRETQKAAGAWSSFTRLLFQERRSPAFGRWEAAVLCLYAVVLAVCIPRHESWFDETQAWLIARSSSLPDLLLRRLHYEGAPALWHLILWVANRLGASFAVMQAIAGVLAAAGVFVWLRYSPLPRLLTWLMPFTFFIQFQYAVVARTYVMAPLFAYLLMRQFQRREGNGVAVALIAGLFANCSLHMAAFASGLALAWAVRQIRPRHWLQDVTRLAPALGVFLVFLSLSAAVAVPTSDGSSTTANPVVMAVRTSVSGQNADAQSGPSTPQQDAARVAAMPPQRSIVGVMLWKAMVQTPSPRQGLAAKLLSPRFLRHVLVFLTAATATVSTSNIAAIGFLALLVVCLGRSGLLMMLLPWVLIQCCNVLITGEAHHFGLLWIALTCAVWALALEPAKNAGDRTLRKVLYSYLLILMCFQVGWSAHAVYGDITKPYSGDRQTAEYLASLPRGTRIAAFDDDSVTVNAYLGKTRYMNHRVDYWPFSRTTDPSLFEDQVMETRPDVVSIKMTSPDRPVMDQWVKLDLPGSTYVDQHVAALLASEGYHATHRFCGYRFFRDAAEATDCRVLFEPLPTPVHPLP